ncbi:MAG: hypothetical protein IJI36_01540 [Kiritimatiellae bacterium]|nr:hypothetical protein [Kiritimatiellia bacterium]
MSVIVQGQFGTKKKKRIVPGIRYKFKITACNDPHEKSFESRGEIKECDGHTAVVELFDNEIDSYIDTCLVRAICLEEKRGKKVAEFKKLHRYAAGDVSFSDEVSIEKSQDITAHNAEVKTEQNLPLPIVANTSNSDVKSVDFEYNRIELIVDIVPVKGSDMREYSVSAVNCPQLPFLEEEVRNSLAMRNLPRSDRGKFEDLAERRAIEYLASFGFSVSVKAELRMGTNAHLECPGKVQLQNLRDSVGRPVPKQPQRIDGHVPNRVLPTKRYDDYANLYVDLGSTNWKWILEDVKHDGETLGFRKVWFAPTCQISSEWGIEYDKQSAYSLSGEKFKEWLAYAALNFTQRVQKEEQVNIVNIIWSFPKLFGRDDADSIDFKECGKYVSEELNKHGLLGRFELFPEGIALKYMFVDTLRIVAKASEAEVKENQRREEQELIIGKRNEEERRKHDESVRKREEEKKAWEKGHGRLYKWFNAFHPKTKEYTADLQNASLGRLEMMKSLRNTGATGDGRFDILILDAGGSTLDFCFMRFDDDRPISGSFDDAGGNRLTKMIQEENACKEENACTFEAAEEYKTQLTNCPVGGAYYSKTVAVYKACLSNIAQKVTMPGSRKLCVVATGLAMLNPNLRALIRHVFKLGEDQMLIFSPDMANAFTEEMRVQFQTLHDFSLVVCRNDLNLEPWPAFDVTGGLYFYKKGVRNA